MSLNPVRPLKSASATATQGSKIVTVSGGVNCSFLRSGSIISIGDKHLVDAVSGTVPDGNGNSTITLRDEWPFTTQTARLIAFMSYEGLADAVVRLNQIADAQSGALEGAFSFMGNWSAVAGDFPPAPGDDLGSQMYRISAAGTMGGRAYRVGELIYYDQFTEQWRPLYEGLGTAATRDVTTSSTDTTSGRLLKVGDFGLTGTSISTSPTNAQIEGQLPNGSYRIDSSQTSSEKPFNFGTLLSFSYAPTSPDRQNQIAISNQEGLLAFRGTQEGRHWNYVYHTRNILGTVSQSAGAPTGAVIERGSNSDGEYVRFADGTQICTRTAAMPDSNAAQDFPYPATFTGAISVSLCGASGELDGTGFANRRRALFITVVSANSSGWRLARDSNTIDLGLAVSGFSARLTAVGRWY